MKINFIKIVAVLTILMTAMVISCKHDPIPFVKQLCFSEEVLPVFQSNCAMSGCHDAVSASDDLVLTDYDGIMNGVKAGHSSRSEIYRAITGKGEEMMPPAGKMSDDLIEIIRLWIDQGAENTSNCGSSCDTASVTYSLHVQPALQSSCTGCHAAGSPSGTNLDGYNAVSAYLAANSQKFINSVNFLPPSPMPKGGNKMSQCSIRKFEIWIAAGYPEN